MGKIQKVYTKEFKQEAVRLAQTSGKAIAQVARELGISDTWIHQWRKELAENSAEAFRGKGHQTQLEEENRRLKRENEILRQEREILKRAMPLRGTTANEQGYTGGKDPNVRTELFA